MISPIESSSAAREYLGRIGASMKTLFTASIVVNSMGYEKDVMRVTFDRRGNVRVSDQNLAPTEAEAAAIREQVSKLEFPYQVTLAALANSGLPDLIKNAPTESLYIFRNAANQIRFIQVRIELDNGDKKYVPQTYWSDGEWRMAEPEEGLPLFNIENVTKGSRVFLHEGAKAARAAIKITEDPSHPWSGTFSTGVHVGWIGGAHHLQRNLWAELQPLAGELIIVPDNDFVSKFRIKSISRRFRCQTYYCKLDNRWPPAWDVADPLPDHFFSDISGMYQGPDFDSLLESCVWATEEIETDGNRPVFVIREEFAQSWVRIQNIRHYANMQQPELTLDKEQFNVKVRPYSNVADTANLLANASGNICDKLTFMPSLPTGLVTVEGEMCLNQYIDRRVKPLKGDTEPFWNFMRYLFPSEFERKQITRWMGTLYAKPSIRMGYGLLLLSKLQGVGKSTLLDLMAEMIGKRHVSFPGDAMVQSDFNGWIVNKRLVVVHEIYAGQNWKTYNRLKSLITDMNIEANTKHVTNYTLPNWTHYAAASNSMEALRMEHDDRRWFVPKLPEFLYDDYESLYNWIKAGGVRNLAAELLELGDYVSPGEHAPMTEAKTALVDQSMPADERMTMVLCERMPIDSCMDVKDVWLWLQSEIRGRAYVTPQRITSMLREKGYVVDRPAQIGSRSRELIWANPEAKRRALGDLTGDDLEREMLGRIKEPGQIFQSDVTM